MFQGCGRVTITIAVEGPLCGNVIKRMPIEARFSGGLAVTELAGKRFLSVGGRTGYIENSGSTFCGSETPVYSEQIDRCK